MQLRFSFVRILPVLLLIPGLAFSATAAGKVRSALGDAFRMKANDKDWSKLKINMNIFQTDRVRTGVESQVVVGLLDGSLITIAENAEVEMCNLLEETEKGAFKTKIDVKKGFINFAVEKQNPKSTFEFKTATATAAIRGTNGFVGSVDGMVFASLSTGKLEVNLDKDGSMKPIVAGETIFGTDELVTLKLSSSGKPKFAKAVRQIFESGEKDVSKLSQRILSADSAVQRESKMSASQSSFMLNTSSPYEVCDAGLNVEGSYMTTNPKATLQVSVGKNFVSDNLIRVADGKEHSFSQSISVSDENGLWNEKAAIVTLTDGDKSVSKTIDLKIDKNCQEVNKMAPSLKFLSYDSIGCRMQVSVGNMQNDVGVLSVFKDGSSMVEEAVARNEQKKFKLDPGSFTYEFVMVDQADNKASLKKTLGCYPMKRFGIDVYGKKFESLKVPPSPPPKGLNDEIVKTLQFKIKNPENDPVFLYKVVVKQNGKVILQETLNQIQSQDYQIPVKLLRNAKNKFDIEVIHKSGFSAKAQKIYEVN